MGGRESTRWRGYRRRRLVEDALCLDLLHPKWKEILCLQRANGTIEWLDQRSVVPSGWLDFHLNPIEGDGTRLLVLDSHRDPDRPTQPVVLEPVQVGFGQRWHARCPGDCRRRARKLYIVTGELAVACWRCSELQYSSAQRHDHRVDLCRKDPSRFVRDRSHLTSLRSRATTAWIFLEAERRGFRSRAT